MATTRHKARRFIEMVEAAREEARIKCDIPEEDITMSVSVLITDTLTNKKDD